MMFVLQWLRFRERHILEISCMDSHLWENILRKWLFLQKKVGKICQLGLRRRKEGTDVGYTGINLENVKNNNRSAILKLLNDQGTMSRKDIAATLGLTPATVSVISSELLSAQVLCELGELQEDKRAGRKKILVGINYDRYLALAVSVESAYTCVSLTNMKGKLIESRRVPTDTTVPPAVFLHSVAQVCSALIEKNHAAQNRILGVGVSIPGLVNRAEGISSYAYRIWNEPVRVQNILQSHLSLPTIVENNVRAFAEAELIFGNGKDRENLLFIKWGPGVGSAIVIHKQIYDSNRSNSKSAEIGHFILNPRGKKCRCGRRGCLETFVSTHAMVDQLRGRCTPERMPQLYQALNGDPSALTAQNFPSFLHISDPAMWKIIDSDVELFARSVCNVVTMLSPDQVIIYGELFNQPQLLEHFLSACEQYDGRYSREYVVPSELRDKTDYIGPLALVVNRLFLSGQFD